MESVDVSLKSFCKLNKALSQAQAKMEFADKNSDNPFFKSKYSSLPDVMKVFQKYFAPLGLSIRFENEVTENEKEILWGVLSFEDEHTKSCILLRPSKMDSQGFKGADTYAKRRLLEGLCGIPSDDDDDGETAVGRGITGSNNKSFNQSSPVQNKQQSIIKANEHITFESAKRYIPTFGKYKDKALGSIVIDDLENYHDWINNSAKESGKKMSPVQQECMNNVKVLVDNFKNTAPVMNIQEPIPEFEPIGPSQSDFNEVFNNTTAHEDIGNIKPKNYADPEVRKKAIEEIAKSH